MKTTKKVNYSTIKKGLSMPIAFILNGMIKTIFRTVKQDQQGFYITLNKTKQYITKSNKSYKGVTTIIIDGTNAINEKSIKATKTAKKATKKATSKVSKAKKPIIEINEYRVPSYTPIKENDFITDEMKEHFYAFLYRTTKQGNKAYSDKQQAWIEYYCSFSFSNSELLANMIAFAGINEKGEQVKQKNPFYLMACKKAYSTSVHLDQDDLFNDLIDHVMTDKKQRIANIDQDTSIYTLCKFAINDLARTDINRLNAQYYTEKMEVQDQYLTNMDENGSLLENVDRVVEYTRIEKVKTKMKETNKRKTIKDSEGNKLYTSYTNTMTDKAIHSFENSVIKNIDFPSLLNDEQMKIFKLLMNDKTKKQIDQMTGKRNDRTYRKIQSILKEYMSL